MKRRELERLENDWRDNLKSLAKEDNFYTKTEKRERLSRKTKHRRPVQEKWED